jgi:AcrR family transcriptional regulator
MNAEARRDRRTVRTRRALQQAFLVLLAERGYERTTVRDVLDRADIGRTTFYAHFPNKAALLDGVLAELRRLLRARAPSSGAAFLPFAAAMFEHAGEHRALYAGLLARRGGAYVLGRIRLLLADLARESLAAQHVAPGWLDAAVHVSVGGLVDVLGYWLTHQTALTASQMCARFEGLVYPGLSALARSE